MLLWQRLWLLFSVMWVVVAALNAVSIFAFADEVEYSKAAWPIGLGFAVPAIGYLLLWSWFKLRRKQSGSDPD